MKQQGFGTLLTSSIRGKHAKLPTSPVQKLCRVTHLDVGQISSYPQFRKSRQDLFFSLEHYILYIHP